MELYNWYIQQKISTSKLIVYKTILHFFIQISSSPLSSSTLTSSYFTPQDSRNVKVLPFFQIWFSFEIYKSSNKDKLYRNSMKPSFSSHSLPAPPTWWQNPADEAYNIDFPKCDFSYQNLVDHCNLFTCLLDKLNTGMDPGVDLCGVKLCNTTYTHGSANQFWSH